MVFENVRKGKGKPKLTSLKTIANKEYGSMMSRTMKPVMIKAMAANVENWKNAPKFDGKRTIASDSIEMLVTPRGPNAELYELVDQGSPPHTIKVQAKGGGLLSFKAGGTYKPKSLPNPGRKVSGGGKVTGGVQTYAKSSIINHPGFEGRNFSEPLVKEILPVFRRSMQAVNMRIARIVNNE